MSAFGEALIWNVKPVTRSFEQALAEYVQSAWQMIDAGEF